MAGILTQAHGKRLETLRRVRHLLQGEEPTIVLQKRDSSSQELVDLISVETAWSYTDREMDGSRLHPAVMYEMQIAEESITLDDVYQTAAVRHGQRRFQIVQVSPGEPGIFPPVGTNRFWRFWLAPLEEI
jgi:hypothetical protein